MNYKKTISLFIIGLIFFPIFAFAQISSEERAKLEAELKQLEAEIASKQQDLKNQKGQSSTLSREITTLKTQIDKARLNIKAKTLQITKLSGQIDEKEGEITGLESKITEQRSSLAQLIRKTNEMDNSNLIHLLLSGENISQFYADVDSFSSIKKELRNVVLGVKETKASTEKQKNELESKQDEALDAKAELEKNRKQVEADQAYRNKLLSLSKNKEKEFESILSQQQKKAAQIKAKLFSFAGGQTAAIPFGTALSYAESAQSVTGVEASFTLAILMQESALGANVGKCYLTDKDSGAGVNVNGRTTYPNVMKPTRDVGPFISITNALGMDPYKTVVSCPIAGAGGWGGAMGPAQFIASTWSTVQSRVASSLGKSATNPWSAPDAIMASATYLSDLGASGGSYASQIRAACKYYGSGGTSCSYGKSVMSKKTAIQSDIDYLKQYGVSRR